MTLMHNMEAKIITEEEAIKLGIGKRINNNHDFIYGVVGKIETDGKKNKKDIVEHFRINTKTGEKETLFEHLEYKKLRDKVDVSKQ